MKRIRLIGCLFVLGLWLIFTAQTALAWPEEPFGKIDISGPGINGVVSITDPDLLAPMTIEGFMDFSHPIGAPQDPGQGYELHRYFQKSAGTYWDFDRVRYYPNPSGGQGYVLYEEGIGYSPAHFAGQWFSATAQGEAALQRILQSIGVSISLSAPAAEKVAVRAAAESQSPVGAPSSSPAPMAEDSTARAVWLLALGGAAALASGLVLFRRRLAHHPRVR